MQIMREGPVGLMTICLDGSRKGESNRRKRDSFSASCGKKLDYTISMFSGHKVVLDKVNWPSDEFR